MPALTPIDFESTGFIMECSGVPDFWTAGFDGILIANNLEEHDEILLGA